MAGTGKAFRAWRVFRRLAPGAAVVLLGVAGVMGLARLPERDRSVPPREPPKVNVTVVQLDRIDQPPNGALRPGVYTRLPDTFTLPGVFEPWATIPLAAEVAGRIELVHVREGDEIAPGEALIELDRKLLEDARDQAVSQAKLDQAELARVRQAIERGVATAMELQRAQAAADVSQAALQSARTRLEYATIQAPENPTPALEPSDRVGVVNELPVKVGQFVRVGDPVAEIVVVSHMKLMVDVPEFDVRHLSVGDEVDVRVQALNDLRTTGRVIFIPRTADPATRTYRVHVDVPNPQRNIRGGMVARVSLVRRYLDDAVMVPLEAVLPLEHGYEVYLSRDGLARQRQVRLGLIQGRFVQLLPLAQGEPALGVGDRLIVDGQRLVSDGQGIVERPPAEELLRQAVQARPAAETAPIMTDGPLSNDESAG